MNVRMWMTCKPLTVGLDLPVVEAARLMAQHKIRRLLVAQTYADGPHLLGIVTAKDVLHAFPPSVNPFAIVSPDARATGTTVSQIMTESPQTVGPDAPIETAAALMCEQKIGALPVMRGRILVGLITESDIFRAFVSMFGADEPGARITFDVTQGEDIFGVVGAMAKRHRLRIASLIWTLHDELPVCVMRVIGKGVDEMLDELWASGHPVMNVIRFAETTVKIAVPSAGAISLPVADKEKEACGLYPSA